MQLKKNQYGSYFVVKWSNQMKHNEFFAKAMSYYFKEPTTLQDNVFLSVPSDAFGKFTYVRNFYKIPRADNEMIHVSGQLFQTVVAKPISVEEFDDVFDGERADYRDLIMAATILGFKEKQIELHQATTNKCVQEKSLSLVIKPMVVFIVE